jgi:FG-GAP repeat/Lectin C-type domain
MKILHPHMTSSSTPQLRFLPALTLVLAAAAQAQTETAKLLPSDGAASDWFGHAVAIDGTTAIVGAVYDDDNGTYSGSAYLFDTTTGAQIAKLLPSDGAAADFFGWSVAIDGTTAIVGAVLDDDKGTNSGSAYLFDTTTGAQIAKLLPSDGAAADSFGYSVAIDGTTAIVGAAYDDDNGTNSGSAYLLDTTTGAQIAKLFPNDGAVADRFGWSVAIAGDTAIVGAYLHDDNGSDSGSAYLFDTTTGAQVAKLLPSDGAAGDWFGESVAINGNTAIVGAVLDDDKGTDSGSVYLFDTTTGGQVAKLLPDDGAVNDRFGWSVAIAGNTAIVGAYLHDDNGSDSGSAYLFDTTTGGQVTKLLPSDGAAGDWFGSSVAFGGNTAMVGAPYDADNGAGSGSAYLFSLGPAWTLSPVSGHWYSPLEPLTWTDAEAQAQSWGGHLATIRSQAENDWLRDNFATTNMIWIGYTDQVVEGTFEWSSGEPVVYENWTVGEPDDAFGADWAVLRPGNGTWFDEPHLPEHPGVVEVISADCDGNGLPDAYQIAQDPWLDWNGDGVLDGCTSPNYCTATANSTGVPSVIGADGSPLMTDNAFTLEAWDLPLNEFAYFLMSESTAFVPGFGGSMGNLCVGSPIVRLNNSSDGGGVLNSGASGQVNLTLDLTSLPQGIVLAPGDVWYFQLWHRDFDLIIGPTSNTSDGIEVMFR